VRDGTIIRVFFFFIIQKLLYELAVNYTEARWNVMEHVFFIAMLFFCGVSTSTEKKTIVPLKKKKLLQACKAVILKA